MNSPRNQLRSLIMHEQSARLLFETRKLPRDMYSKQRVAIPSLLFQPRLPLPRDPGVIARQKRFLYFPNFQQPPLDRGFIPPPRSRNQSLLFMEKLDETRFIFQE